MTCRGSRLWTITKSLIFSDMSIPKLKYMRLEDKGCDNYMDYENRNYRYNASPSRPMVP